MTRRLATIAIVGLSANIAIAIAQQFPGYQAGISHPAINYASAPVNTAVTALNQKLEAGAVSLAHEPVSGYLRATLEALDVPIESQVLVYTKTSQQFPFIDMENPRALYFSDTVAVGFARGAPLIEVWAQDPKQGSIFYTIEQQPREGRRASFQREMQCLACHLSVETLRVPGPMVLTTFPREFDYQGADGHLIDHRDALNERWGGWYVTGNRLPARHMGNLPLFMSGPPPVLAPAKSTLTGSIDLKGYLSPYSDVVALMVLDHQLHAMNLITRAGWEARAGNGTEALQAAYDLADYLLFVGEAHIPSRIEGSSGFAEKFSARGPKDSRGRSLRELQLEGRLMKYPLSYMVYSPAFQALSSMAKDPALARLQEVLSGGDKSPRYAHLTPETRQAILEILKDTLPGFVTEPQQRGF